MANDYGRDYLGRAMNGTHDNDTPPGVGRAARKAQETANGYRAGDEWHDGPNAMVDYTKPVKGK
jgi:hypothetical protein